MEAKRRMNPHQTLLNLIQHIVVSHPDLHTHIEQLFSKEGKKALFDTKFLKAINADLLRSSKAQLRQDIFVLNELNFKRDGYFVEFGATNGVDLSNTYLLEKGYNWKGIS
jgi:hypothetical protein